MKIRSETFRPSRSSSSMLRPKSVSRCRLVAMIV